MVDYKYAEIFYVDSINKELEIISEDNLVHITNTELNQEKFELAESLCSESDLRFGCCEASSVKFKISNIFQPLNNKWLIIKETLDRKNDAVFQFGRYKVYSDKPTADRRYREVEAYDAMYDIINADVANWYNSVLPEENSSMTMLEFRTSFIGYFGLEQEKAELINDSMIVQKTIQPEEISGKDVITAICEINGCFGHINRNGKFQYIYLKQNIQGLYPRDDLYPSNDLFPKDSDTHRIGKSLYISCEYEDFVTKTIEKIQIRQEENDIGIIIGEGNNAYIIEDNFLVYGKSSEELSGIARNILSVIRGIMYRPFSAEAKGNPCLEVGDAIRLPTRYELIESYILKRTLKGIQALRDNYETQGEEYYSEKVNSVQKSIIQLKGKTNTLTRTIEETKSEIKDVEQGLTSSITQTAQQIRTEINNTKENLESSITQTAEQIRTEVRDIDNGLQSSISQTATEIRAEISNTKDGLESSITQTAEQIKQEVSSTYETKENANETKRTLESSITQTSESIRSEVSATYETKNKADETRENLESSITQTAQSIKTEVAANYETKAEAGEKSEQLYSAINQTAENIALEVQRAQGMEDLLAASINVNAGKIESKISKGSVSSEISQESDMISISAGRFKLETDNLLITPEGSIESKEGVFSAAEIICNYSEGDDGYPINGLHIQRDGTTKINFVSAGLGGVASKGEVHSKQDVTADRNIIALGNVTGYYIGAGDGGIATTGTKARVVRTKNFGNKTLYCYEMSSPVFGDIGSGRTDETGYCIIFLDAIFAETVNAFGCEYYVFLTPYGKGNFWVEERNSIYFTIHGEPLTEFAWEIKAKQKDYEYTRLEEFNEPDEEIEDLLEQSANYIQEVILV